MSRVVRASKFRHVFGTPAKKENIYDGLKPSRSAWDSNKVTASKDFVGIIWDASGGGAFAVLDIKKTGKLGQFPLITGHSGEVLDIQFSPFVDNIIASGSEDCYAKIWSIPAGGLTENMTTAAQTLSGHRKKVGAVNFNPVASNVLATASADGTVKFWDIETGQVKCDVGDHPDVIQSTAWDWTGSYYATASKDKKVRLVDPRGAGVVADVEAHPGVKGMRLTFLGNKNKLFTMGFSKTSERQFSIWDHRNITTPLRTENIDTASGIIMPLYDNDTNMLYLAGKGDGNIRYYEVVDEAPYVYFLSEFKSATPQRGIGLVPKLSLDFSSCEISRLLKITATACEPISFTVPRKGDIFQDDLYPPTIAGEPTLSAAEWFSGKNSEPKLITVSPGSLPTKSSQQTNFQTVVVEEKKLSEKELRDENEKQKKRIAHLESELAKRDARIKELEN
eukprot:TRINITY_DN515_c1_g1_i1.p2 TRINITY_DN515_c1_g1~~TRINITY_DN515_c1_g1_i1.p2  ORF type:complete len:449 (-),score=237.23 TRINITY_DN515_c1_g1_i1:130-1476(-)